MPGPNFVFGRPDYSVSTRRPPVLFIPPSYSPEPRRYSPERRSHHSSERRSRSPPPLRWRSESEQAQSAPSRRRSPQQWCAPNATQPALPVPPAPAAHSSRRYDERRSDQAQTAPSRRLSLQQRSAPAAIQPALHGPPRFGPIYVFTKCVTNPSVAHFIANLNQHTTSFERPTSPVPSPSPVATAPVLQSRLSQRSHAKLRRPSEAQKGRRLQEEWRHRRTRAAAAEKVQAETRAAAGSANEAVNSGKPGFTAKHSSRILFFFHAYTHQ